MVKFKSKVTGDLIMLDLNGRQILKIIGKEDSLASGRGILLPEHMPAAIAALHSAILQEEEARARLEREAHERGETPARPQGITLRHRALPFIDMMQRCQQAGREIVWGD